VQELASAEDQVSVEDWPAVIVAGDAERETVGAAEVVTVTITLWEAEPPAPVQLKI